MNIPAQIVGIIGLIVITVGMQSKNKKNMLLAQTITNSCFMIQYFMLGAITGAVMYIVNTIRTFTFYTWDKKYKPNIFLLLIFVILAIGFGVYTYKGIYSLLPIIGSLASTYGGWQKEAKIMRVGMMISSSILIIHDLHFGAYSGMMTYIFVFSSSLISFIRFDILKKDLKLKNELEGEINNG